MAWICKAPVEVVLGIKKGLDLIEKPLESEIAEVTEGGLRIKNIQSQQNRFDHLITRFREYTDRIFSKYDIR